MIVHHRNYRYRPPRRVESHDADTWGLFWRFFREYAYPRKWSLLACMVLTAATACSVYLMSFYGRIMVDEVLVIRPAPPEQVDPSHRVVKPDRDRPVSRPRESLGSRFEQVLAPSDRPAGAARRLWLLALVYMGTQLTLNVLSRLANRRRIHVGQWITARLREDMHKKVLELSMAYHHAHSPGRLLSRIVSDVGMVQSQMLNTIMSLTQAVSMLLVGTLILVTADWRMTLIAFAVVPLYAIIYSRARPQIKEFSREMRHTNSCMYSLTSQKVDAMKAVQAYGRERQEQLAFHRLAAVFLRDALLQQRLSAGLSRAATIISGVGTSTIFIFGAYLVLNGGGSMTLGKMMFVSATTANLFQPVLQITRLGVTLNYLTVILQRIADVLDHPLDIIDDPEAVEFPRPLTDGIRLEHVSFTYPAEEEAEEPEPVLRDVNLRIPAGSWMCIMGPSGCGKTTLLHLLSRLYEPTRGRILFDGVPLASISMSSLREAVGVVPQEAQIFSGTVRDNICYGVGRAEPQQIMDAAKAAQLHDFILEMNVQYETLIGEKGTSLSGGQRQRLSLARALMTDPHVLILDDCTSALDAETERRIQDTLAEILVGKTAVIVSQRVSMAKRCHCIAVLENGMISEVGTHDDLVGNGGFYSRLHAQQTE